MDSMSSTVSKRNDVDAGLSRVAAEAVVESRNGAVRGRLAVARFRSPLIKPDVRISRIRLSDWFHLAAFGGCLRFQIQLSLQHPDLTWCFQADRQSPHLCSFQSTPEVRALSSTGITRLPRSYDPFRLPLWPPLLQSRWSCDLHQQRISPNYPDHPLHMPCSLPRRIGTGAYRFLPCPHGLPPISAGSASATSLSRPAQASLTLRPAQLLTGLKPALSQGFDPAGYPTEPLVSYQSYRLLSGWNLPPLVLHAFGTHTGSPGLAFG